ncbi:hypothetical protein EUX98_g8122 [Antrodiella citrinella]|uniref:RRM domain-containing protein n=1 Tax=Antrodiella citrinella TaxID=2447956 RepID=A0A4S4MCN8_9APHY|nr:hypothetical protein EUX98_g8122 [Antrodiella citrinella]
MDDAQTAFANQYQQYGIDLDMMKRRASHKGNHPVTITFPFAVSPSSVQRDLRGEIMRLLCKRRPHHLSIIISQFSRPSPKHPLSASAALTTAQRLFSRSMDSVGGPDAKKARWSPTSFAANGLSNNPNGGARDAFANYGYGPQATIAQQNANAFANGQQQGQNFNANALYSTPSLSINTNTSGNGMQSQMSPNTAGPYTPQSQQASANAAAAAGYGNFAGYSMLGMGIPAMNVLSGFPYNAQMGNFNQQRLPTLQIPSPAQSPYSPAALSAVMNAQNNATGRTVYVGNLPATASVDELLNLVHFGPLESIRVLPEKSCVFLSFLDGSTAAAFHADALIKKLALHGQELKIGWGKPSPVPSQVALAIQQSNASRNVYLGGLDENVTEEQLRDDLSRFGLIDQVKIVRDKNIGFVHFLSISTATKVVNTLPTEPAWAGKRVNYGKDRCAYIPKSQQAAAQAAQAAAAQSLVAQSAAALSPIQTNMGSAVSPITPYSMPFSDALNGMAGMNGNERDEPCDGGWGHAGVE